MSDHITIVHTYYNHPIELINIHLVEWGKINKKFSTYVKFIIIDDNSYKPLSLKFKNLSIYRILDDIKWNQGGARNLGFFVASTPWIFYSDIDHVVTFEAFEQLLNFPKKKGEYYKVSRNIKGEIIDNTAAITGGGYLIHRADFFKVGGYDEDYSGHYGFEDLDFHNRLSNLGVTVNLLPQIYTICYPNMATTNLDRDIEVNRELYNKKVNNLPVGGIMRFRWLRNG